MKSVWQCTWALWEEISVKVKHAVVYMDTPCAEILHWQGGMSRLLHAGATDVRQFSSFERPQLAQKKAVFIVSKLLRDEITQSVLKDIISQSDLQYVIVITTVSGNIHAFDRSGNAETEDKKDFDDLEDQVLQWMGNMNYTAEVLHIPLLTVNICPELFVTPAFCSLFPLLDTDLQHVQLLYNKDKGERTSFDSLSEIESHHLPRALLNTFKKFSCCLHGLLSDLGVREDLYSVGHTSRMLATEIENYPPAKIRRKNVPHRASVVLIDRTLDLATPGGHQFESLLDKIVTVLPSLPSHNTDVIVDMTSLCSVTQECGQTIVAGSLTSGEWTSQPNHLQNLVINKHKECVMHVNRRLVEAATSEKLPVNLAARPGRVTAEQLDKTLHLFRGKYAAVQPHIDVLQVAMATSQALKHPKTGLLDNLLSTEKNLVQLAGDETSDSALSHLTALLRAQLKLPSHHRSHSVDDILLSLVFLYSMSGAHDHCRQEEQDIQELLVDAVMEEKRDLPPVIKSIVGDAANRTIVEDLLENMWSKLTAVGAARDDLKHLRHVLEPCSAVSPASSKPLLTTMVQHIFSPDKPELHDLEFKSSGLKDFLKSGFGLFMNVNKPRPSDHPLLMIFVVGGVTATEVKQIRDVAVKLKSDTQVIVGSTRLLRGGDLLNSVLCQNNVDPAVVV